MRRSGSRFRRAAAAVTLAAIPLAAAANARPGLGQGVDPALAEARELSAAGRPEAAVELLVEAGRRRLLEQRTEEALVVLVAAIEAAPDAARTHALLGSAYLRAGRHGPALDHLERAVAAGIDDPQTLFLLATALWESSRLDEAEQVLRRVLASGRGVGPALHQLGRLLLWRGRSGEAVELLGRAAVLFADDAGVQMDLGRAAAAAGDEPASLAAARRAVALAPNLPAARYGLAVALARAGDADGARVERQAAGRLYGEVEERTRRLGLERARLDRGWDLLRQDRPAEAAAWFAALEESPDALAGQAAALSAAGDRTAAARALQRAVELAPERDDLRLALADLRLGSPP